MSDSPERLNRLPGLLEKFAGQGKFEFTNMASAQSEGRFARGVSEGFHGLRTILREQGEAGLHEALSNKGKLEAMGFSRNTAAALQESTADFMDGKVNEFKASRAFGDAVKTEVSAIRAIPAVRAQALAEAADKPHVLPTEAHGKISKGRVGALVAFSAALVATGVALFSGSDEKPAPEGSRSVSGTVTQMVLPAAVAAQSISSSAPSPVEAQTAASSTAARPAAISRSAPPAPPQPDAMVLQTQEFLLEQGPAYQRLMSDGATGLRGQQFTNALTHFQRSHSLEASGELNRDTILLMNEIRQQRVALSTQAESVNMDPLKPLEAAPPPSAYRRNEPGPG